MANGLDAQRLRKQWAEDRRAERAARQGLLDLQGSRVRHSGEGRHGPADDVLAEADWVVASVHYGQNQPREQITDRIARR